MLSQIDRLTEYNACGMADAVWRDETYPCHKLFICPEGNCNNADACDFAIRIKRLAAYEDTRMTPDDVMRMKDTVKRLRKQIAELKAKAVAGTPPDAQL